MWTVIFLIKASKEELSIRCYADSQEESVNKAVEMAVRAGEFETLNDVEILKVYFRK